MNLKEIFGLRKRKQKTESEKEIVLNETIQGVFFGVPFGATVDEVIEGFAKYDLIPDGEMQRERLYFVSKKNRLHLFWRICVCIC